MNLLELFICFWDWINGLIYGREYYFRILEVKDKWDEK